VLPNLFAMNRVDVVLVLSARITKISTSLWN